jgi:hypothetical protein
VLAFELQLAFEEAGHQVDALVHHVGPSPSVELFAGVAERVIDRA